MVWGNAVSYCGVVFPDEEGQLNKRASEAGVPFKVIGTVGGSQLKLQLNGAVVVDEAINELNRVWTSSLEEYANRVG